MRAFDGWKIFPLSSTSLFINYNTTKVIHNYVYLQDLFYSQSQKKILQINKSCQMNKGLLLQQKQKLRAEENVEHNLEEMFFQERDWRGLDALKYQLLDSLVRLTQRKYKSNLMDTFVQNYRQQFTSFITFQQDIQTLVQQFDILKISHKHHTSQAIHLALLLAHSPIQPPYQRITLFTHQNYRNNLYKAFQIEQEEDTQTYIQSCLQKEGIQVVDLKGCSKIEFGEGHIVIVDLFGLNPIQYYLHFDRLINIWKKASKVVIYHSELQLTQVGALLDLVERKGQGLDYLCLELSPKYPLKTFYHYQEDELMEEVMIFLNSIGPYAQKQDIIIFYPLDESFHKYLRRFKQTIVKSGYKDAINIITQNNMKLHKDRSNVFMVSSNNQLKQFNYNYSKVLVVFNYGYMASFTFDYQFGCWSQSMDKSTVGENCERMAWVGSDRCGIYHQLVHQDIHHHNSLNHFGDITSFVITAIKNTQHHLVDFQHPRVQQCLSYLKQVGIIEEGKEQPFKIRDQRFTKYIEEGVNPVDTKAILLVQDDCSLCQKDKKKYLNLVAMAIATLRQPQVLRKVKYEMEGSHIKPYAVWRKSGYLQSCLQIITKCQLIQYRKQARNSTSQDYRRKTSKVLDGKQELYTKHQNKRKKNFQEMQVSDLILDYTVNEQLLHIIRDKVDEIRFAFDFEMLPILLDREAVGKTMGYLLGVSPRAGVVTYTGSKSTQYFNGKSNILVSDTCLYSILNQRPQTLRIIRLVKIEGEKKIMMANSITDQCNKEKFSDLKLFSNASLVGDFCNKDEQRDEKMALEVTKKFSFENVASAVFEALLKNDGAQVQQFEIQNNCHLSLVLDTGVITVNCFKDQIENKNYVKENLSIVLKKIEDYCKFYTKKLHYMGVINMIIGEGGTVLEVIDSDEISRILVSKLPEEIAKEYIEVVLQDFPIKSIQMIDPDQYEPLPQAVVEFHTRKAFKDFEKHYKNNMKKEGFFKMKPIKDSEYNKMQKIGEENKYGLVITTLLFRWYIWKSHCKAQVRFSTREAVKVTLESFQVNPLLDGVPVKLQTDPKDNRTIIISNLKAHTDEIFISQVMKEYGTIESVEILKTPLKETRGDEEHIGHLLKIGANRGEIVKYRVISMEKKQCGLRMARVAIQDNNLIKRICEMLDKTVGYFGEGRLYVEPVIQRQILIPQGCLEIYTELFEELLEDNEKEREKVRIEIRQDGDNLFLVLISSIEESLLFVLSRFKDKLNGNKIDFPMQARNVILNQIGVANFLDLEDKLNCKFIISSYSNKIRVLAKRETLEVIAHEVRERIQNHFFYRVSLTSKVYKHYQQHPEIVQKLLQDFQLNLAELQEDNWALLLQGSAINIQATLSWLHEKSKGVFSESRELALNDCGICGSPLQESYRLLCEHRFCKQCLVEYLHYSFSDMSQFPFKCPDINCLKRIACIDLQYLLDWSDWHRMRILAANQFLKHSDGFDYCMTPGCEQINRIKKDNVGGIAAQYLRCDICKNTYCLSCNDSYHPARTCKQAKMSEDQLLKNYIKDQGVRKCVGPRCKALVVRYTGCFKVTCTRCTICMCFKCPDGKMEAFQNSQQCYDHLSAVHGGFF